MKILKDKQKLWDELLEINSADLYGKGVLTYLQKYAELMEKDIIKGNKLEDVAYRTRFEADTEGITGLMYGMAVNILSTVWEYGEELRIWHNKRHGYEGEGCINPVVW